MKALAAKVHSWILTAIENSRDGMRISKRDDNTIMELGKPSTASRIRSEMIKAQLICMGAV